MGVLITGRIPTPQMMREASGKIFEADSGLRVKESSWQYRTIPEKGVAAVRFDLSNGSETVFSNVTIIARFDKIQPSKMLVQASIGALSSMVREFYVAEDFPDLVEETSTVPREPLVQENGYQIPA